MNESVRSGLSLEIVSIGQGTDALTGKKGPGVLLVMEDGERFFTWKGLQMFIGFKMGTESEQNGRPDEES